MILPFGVPWLCTLLLWGCICFPPQKGYNIAHGYSVNDDRFSSHAGVLGSQTSNQFHPGASSSINHDPVSPRDEIQAVRHQSFVSPQREPVHHENNEDASSVGEEMVQSNPSVQKHEHGSSGYQHPFGLLIKDTQRNTVEGISFPTISDVKRFVETMKSSFLTPGSHLRRHFQTAQEIMENEVASNAQNIKGEPDMDFGSNSAKEGTAHDKASENEVWSAPMNEVFEQSEQGANNQMSSESASVSDPVVSSESLIPTSVYDSQDLGPGSALYPLPHLAAKEHVSSNYGNFDIGRISGENPNVFTSAPGVQHEDFQSTSYKLPEQIPSGSFFEEDFSFSGHVTASPVYPASSPPQDFSYYSSEMSNITPLTSEKNIKHPKYTPNSEYFLVGYQTPSGSFELKDFHSKELRRETPANVLSAKTLPSLNSYGKSIYVNAPKSKLYIPDYLPKQRDRPAPSFQPYQPTDGKESKDTNYTPTIHLPVSRGSVSSSTNNLSPQSSREHVGVQLSSPHDAQNQAFNRKQPLGSHQVFNVKPFNTLHHSSIHDGYVGDQRVSVTHSSILTDQENDEQSDLSEPYPVSAVQEPKQMTDKTLTTISGGLDSTRSGISSPLRVDYASFNSVTNLAPPSASEMAFSRFVGNEVMSRNFRIKNIILDRFPTGVVRGARNTLGSFFTPKRRGISLNGGYIGATVPSNMAYQPPNQLSASKVSGSSLNGVFRRNGGNTKRHTAARLRRKPTPSVNAYVVKSTNRYVRNKVSVSKTQYAPYQLDDDKTLKHQWKPAERQHKYENTVSHNAKGFEEP